MLFEMLTGRRAFAGDDVSEVLASVLAREPDWARLPTPLSPALGTCIRRCLDKNPSRRWHCAADLRIELETVAADPRRVAQVTPDVGVVVPARTRRLRMALLALLSLTAGALVAVLAQGFVPQREAPAVRFTILPPDKARFDGGVAFTGRWEGLLISYSSI